MSAAVNLDASLSTTHRRLADTERTSQSLIPARTVTHLACTYYLACFDSGIKKNGNYPFRISNRDQV